jgi:uncharacterized membrane protein
MLKIDRLFLSGFLTLGLLYAFITPPYMVPDELHHFLRSYQLATGTLRENREVNLPLMPDYLSQDAESIGKLAFHPERHYSLGELRALWNSSPGFNSGGPSHYKFITTASYSPVAYLPHIIALSIGRLLSAKVLLILYAMRLSGLIACGLLLARGFKIIRQLSPRYALLYMAIAFLPMNISQSMGISTDGITNALSLLCIALGLDMFRSFSGKKHYMFLLVTLLLGLCKGVIYAAVPVVFEIVMLYELRDTAHGRLRKAGLFVAALMPALLWNMAFGKLSAMSSPAAVQFQRQFVMAHPFIMAKVLLRTIPLECMFFWSTMMGNFGYMDTPCPSQLVVLYGLFILVLALIKNDAGSHVSLIRKTVFWLVPFLFYCVLGVALYINWTAPHAPFVMGIQGRYFIPVVLLPLIGMPVCFSLSETNYNRKLLPVAAVCICVINLYCLTAVIAPRFW